jgi:DNA topoisomerase-1
VYAEANDSIGLCTLQRRHVRVHGARVDLRFRAKSGKDASLGLEDRAVARVVSALMEQRGRRLFHADGRDVDAEDVNERLAELSAGLLTVKDFRTWIGTRTAFAALRRDGAAEDREQRALAAIDAAAAALGNTRAVARAHYVHPHIIETYLDGSFGQRLAASRPPRLPGMDQSERALLGYLDALLREYGAPRAVTASG